MQAIISHHYGPPADLQLGELPGPPLGDDQVLLRVRAASVNPLDWHECTGLPYLMRLSTLFRRRSARPLGNDVAGRVEAVGSAVTDLHPGDEVFGVGHGSFADRAVVSSANLVRRPASVTAVASACVPIAGVSALQALRDKGGLQKGERVLVIGASGGVGTFAVQLARAMGAGEITAVCSAANAELVRSIGADHVIDYQTTDVTRQGRRYDVVLDNAGTHPFRHRRRALAADGRWVLVGFPKGRLLAGMDQMVRGAVLSPFGRGSFRPFLASVSGQDLQILADHLEAGTIEPVVGQVLTLAEVPRALDAIASGHTRGKIAIVVDDGDGDEGPTDPPRSGDPRRAPGGP